MLASDNSKTEYFYLWRHRILLPDDNIVTRTCFGITGHPERRLNKYEGHNGHRVQFDHVWVGLYRPILDLERRCKEAFHEHQLVGFNNYRYEWIDESVPFEQVLDWVRWEVEDHPSISYHGPIGQC
jgi:hypothetical protein